MILLTGITGNIGGATARALLAKGVRFRALVRDLGKASAWADQGVELVQGDFEDAESIRRALSGVDSALLVLPNGETQERLELSFIRTAKEVGLPWMIKLSSPEAVRAAFDLGPVRTLQDDVEFGVRQIVDIALKAISPAVNDPSTAATCIDHLGRLLIRLAGRRAPASQRDGLVVPQPTHVDLIDLAFEQIRQYGKGDMAIALRLLRVLGDIASVTRDRVALERLATHGRLVEAAARTAFAPEDCDELDRRAARLRGLTLR